MRCDSLKETKSMSTKRMHSKSASRTEDSDAQIKHDISEKVVRIRMAIFCGLN